jgi:hypothetical protein
VTISNTFGKASAIPILKLSASYQSSGSNLTCKILSYRAAVMPCASADLVSSQFKDID